MSAREESSLSSRVALEEQMNLNWLNTQLNCKLGEDFSSL